LEVSGGMVYYITNAGIAQPYQYSPLTTPGNELSSFYSQSTNTPTAITNLSNINADRNYIYTNPTMQIGNNKYQQYSSGYEGSNVYANNSQPLTFTDSSYAGCFNTSIPTIQQNIMTAAPDSASGNYTFQSCQQAAFDSGSQFFSFNVANQQNQTGMCYLANNDASFGIIEQGPALNYTYKQLWSSNITNVTNSDMSGNYMGIDPAGNIVIYNSSNSAIWSSDGSNNNASLSNFIGCYQNTELNIQPYTVDETRSYREYTWWGGHKTITTTVPVTMYKDTRQAINVNGNSDNTWETCYQAAYEAGSPYFGVGPFNPSNNTTTCYLSTDLSNITAGGNAVCQQPIGGINYGDNGSLAVYSATTAPLNTFLTLQDTGIVTAFNGTNLFDMQSQNITWQLDVSGEQQMSNYYIITNATYSGYMQTGQTLQEGQSFCSPNATIFLTMQNGNLVLYTSSNTPKCYLMNSNGNEYYAGDISMNALYLMNIIGQPASIGNVGYVDPNSFLYPKIANLFQLKVNLNISSFDFPIKT
jgi:hypothetical protein